MGELPSEPDAQRAAERYRALLEINNAVVSRLTRQDLFAAIARAIRRVIRFDRTALFLHDAERDVLRLFVLESSLASEYFVEGFEVNPDASHVGWAFRRRQTLLRHDLDHEREFPAEDLALKDGVRSYVVVPLLGRDGALGALGVASTMPNQYSDTDALFFQEVAGQIALAVENMKAYEAISDLSVRNARLYEDLTHEVAQRRQAEETLQRLAEGTANVTGADFFRAVVRHLASALGVRYVFVAECVEGLGRTARTLAFWNGDGPAPDFEYELAGSPCTKVLEGRICHYAEGLQELFPGDQDLKTLGAESYLGLPMLDASGRVIGHLVLLHDGPMKLHPATIQILRIFAARAGAELERSRAELGVRQALAEVEDLKARLERENVYLQEEIQRTHNFEEIVGSSPALMAALRKVEQVAATDSTVLISGETGTGKELIARAVHDRSPRRGRPLVKVNCSAISAGLLESELFGHVKGAFTGALERRTGRFELADGGTIFLDEVGELPPESQVKLLRVLQEREFEPVGSSRTIAVDVRVIAATNRDLEEAVRAGRFRADLFYRLNVFPIGMPPLRRRREDIPQLVTFFLSRYARKFGKAMESVSADTMGRLMDYPWPGNIRELQNVIERALVLTPGPVLEVGLDLLPSMPTASPEVPGPGFSPAGPLPTLEDMERRHVLTALERSGWVIEGPNGAARILALHPNTLRSRMERMGIRRPRHDPS